ncbi:response regulator transcription factor [Natribacillus halophilus]|uniref:Two-component response regulator, YesN/AraC family, consists of REC and AraC-type DNA-binding domains n=1 Tax=Natribacillus halophilus TaxID=549003 RepID=A0A1G8PC49_9BACI|nr:response regulator transcription factor [Natribacillus halophilus]SDI90151.1 Two-component response regulator, YesN/AraC family, consists of REC and AraC-type DNA-binding domains [Natribacillus halophilus]
MLIADRDKEEIQGIQWFLAKYSMPITTIRTAESLSDLVDELENSPPDMVCMELEMMARDKWEVIKSYLPPSSQVMAMTAEPTFERAMQALELQVVDLWVKPLSPPQVKRALQKAVEKLSSVWDHPLEQEEQLSYESLFIEDGHPYPFPVMLLKPENINDLTHLRKFIEQFDFYYDPLVFSLSDRIALVFKHEYRDPLALSHRFLREWSLVAGTPLAVVVHKQKREASLHQVYGKLRKRMEITFFTGYNQVLDAEAVSDWQVIDPFLTMEEQRKWVYMLEEGRGNEIKTWLYEEFFALEPPYPEPGLLRTRLTSILAQVRRFMDRNGVENEEMEAYYKTTFDKILYSPVLYRIVQDMFLFINHLVDLRTLPSTGKTGAVEQAVSYMEEQFADASLTLTKVAAYVELSPSYLSHLLSKSYQRSFREILLSIRLQKAREMLRYSDESIQNIAWAIGFNNANYFSRVFKMYTGQTPRVYRRSD